MVQATCATPCLRRRVLGRLTTPLLNFSCTLSSGTLNWTLNDLDAVLDAGFLWGIGVLVVDEAGVDVILVGDSASNVMAGHETTLPITLDQMIYHASSVVRAVNCALVVVDLPFGYYQGNSRLALESAIRIMKEAGAHAVKLEG